MNLEKDSILYEELEKKFSIFRWFLIILIAPLSLGLSDYQENVRYLVFFYVLTIIYGVTVTIAAYSKKNHLKFLLRYTIYFDIPFITLILAIRGGLRSDVYVLYFLVITYNTTKYGGRGTIISLFETIVYFSIVAFLFTPVEFFHFNRYLIRVVHLSMFTVVTYEVNNQIAKSRKKEEKMKDLAYKDPLTGLYNRLALPERYDKMKQDYELTGEKFAILLFDIDDFKMLNDSKGHAFGDEVLTTIGAIIRDQIRNEDFTCRLGGEEFLVILEEADEEKAYARANTIREEITSYKFYDKPITVSIGISMFIEQYSMIDNISFADEAMYMAKRTGKNKVRIYNYNN